MELITIILYSLLILVVALVVFVGISYVVSSLKKRNDRSKLVAQSYYQPVAPNYATPVVDNIVIRKEVDTYYDNPEYQEQQQVIEEEYHPPVPKIKRVRRKEVEPVVKRRDNRYSIVNTIVETEEYSLATNSRGFNPSNLNDYFGNYEDDDNGIYYNIKIGA